MRALPKCVCRCAEAIHATDGTRNCLSVVNGLQCACPTYRAAKRERKAPQYRAESRPPVIVGKRLASSSDVFAAMEDLRAADREHFVAFMLNVRHRVISRKIVAIGHAAGVEVHPRETFRDAISVGACAMIIAHNHPSGEPTPSRADIELTARLREAGELLGIVILDHVVVAAEGFVSLAERGWK